MKTLFMLEIAQEHGVEWDPKSLDDGLYTPYSSQQDWSGNAGDDQDQDPRVTYHTSGWMINSQEIINDDNEDDSNDDIVNLSPKENSISSDDSTKSTPVFSLRLIPPPYIINNPNKTGTDNIQKNKDVFNHSKVVVKSRKWIKGGALPRVKIHPTECGRKPAAVEEWERNERADSTVSPPHVHPKLPDYDDIKARFVALRSKS
ncbi:hypothetical protein L1987_87826 [Smallanthus sonchifolius]|nr:hypothetical protein L1987_87826 [Smallanthus sonchifolius]